MLAKKRLSDDECYKYFFAKFQSKIQLIKEVDGKGIKTKWAIKIQQ